MAFHELVSLYKKKVYCLAFDIIGNHHDAEDISQEVFIKVFRSLNNFRRDAKMSSWLYKITVNASIDFHRKKAVKKSTSFDEVARLNIQEDPLPHQALLSDPVQDTQASQIQKQISLSLQKITPKERAVFVMRHYNDLKTDEIAEIMNIKTGTVKSLLFRAITKLRKELSPFMGNQIMGISNE